MVVAAPPQPVVVSTVVFGEYPVTMTNSKGQQVSGLRNMLQDILYDCLEHLKALGNIRMCVCEHQFSVMKLKLGPFCSLMILHGTIFCRGQILVSCENHGL